MSKLRLIFALILLPVVMIGCSTKTPAQIPAQNPIPDPGHRSGPKPRVQAIRRCGSSKVRGARFTCSAACICWRKAVNGALPS